MAIDTKAPISRRGLLAAAVGGVAAAAAGTVASAQRVFAAGSDGETMVIGGKYDDVRSTTRLKRIGKSLDEPQLKVVNEDVDKFGRKESTFISGQIAVVASDPINGTTSTNISGGFVGVSNGGAGVSIDHRGIRASGPDFGLQARGSAWAALAHGDAGGLQARSKRTAIKADGKIGVEADGETCGVRGKGREGVVGIGRKRGARFRGRSAQVRLEPSKKESHPTRGQRGDLFVDKDGNLWFCKGNTRWFQLA